jgi:hypothetical protein
MDQSLRRRARGRKEPTPVRRRKYPVSEFIRPLSPDSHQDVEPTSSAELSIVLEPAPDPTIAELVCSLVTAIFNAVSDRISPGR